MLALVINPNYNLMKKMLLFSIFTLSVLTSFAQVKWITLDEALVAQKDNPKKIIMDVYTNWCGPCKLLDKNTFQNKDVAAYINENYYAVKFNGEGNSTVTYADKTFSNPKYDPAKKNTRNYPHQLTQYLRVSAYPTVVFFDEKGGLIAPIRGYIKPNGMELYLKLFANDDYLKVNKDKAAWDEYQRNFKPTFKTR